MRLTHNDTKRRMRDASISHDARRGVRGGFTLLEMIIVVAIFVVLLSLIMVNIVVHRRNLKTAEANTIAKEIFIAAQNHLTTAQADSVGLKELTEFGTQGTATVTEEGGVTRQVDASSIRYFLVPGDDPDATGSLLGIMLPFGSIDEYVRNPSKGSYLIRYDKDALQVLDVFYAPETHLSAGDYQGLYDLRDIKLPTQEATEASWREHADARKRFGASGAIVGYYGGVAAGAVPGQLAAPGVRVDNGDTLQLVVTNPSSNLTADEKADGSAKAARLRLLISGVTSKARTYLDLIDKNGVNTSTAHSFLSADPASGDFTVVLDDITASGAHFADLTKDGSGALASKDDGKSFIPGESLLIVVEASCTGKISTIGRSASVRCNSLFGSLRELDATGTYKVRIKNIRHLENLDPKVSGVAQEFGHEGKKVLITLAEQTRNISWSGFCEAMKRQDDDGVADPHAVTIAAYAPSDPAEKWLTDGGCYYPVDVFGMADAGKATGEFSYDGKGHKVSDLVVGSGTNGASAFAGNGGMFSALWRGTKEGDDTIFVGAKSIADLRVTNATMRATGKVGALAGTISGIAGVGGTVLLSDVHAYNSIARANQDDGETSIVSETDAAYVISGGKETGGLVGSISYAELYNCGAATYVQAASESAGGLAGSATNSSVVASYAGGHTVGGSYSSVADDSSAGRVNVLATTGAAGGLVGTFGADSTMAGSYATCSAQGTTAVGGLVGSCQGTIAGCCYATGLVVNGSTGEGATPATLGAFAGKLSGAGKVEKTQGTNYYLDGVNNPTVSTDEGAVGAVGSGADAVATDALVAADDTTDAYKAFAGGSNGAISYDSTIRLAYRGRYPFQTISQLADGITAPEGVTTVLAAVHHGDWPDVEMLVPNTKTGS